MTTNGCIANRCRKYIGTVFRFNNWASSRNRKENWINEWLGRVGQWKKRGKAWNGICALCIKRRVINWVYLIWTGACNWKKIYDYLFNKFFEYLMNYSFEEDSSNHCSEHGRACNDIYHLPELFMALTTFILKLQKATTNTKVCRSVCKSRHKSKSHFRGNYVHV